MKGAKAILISLLIISRLNPEFQNILQDMETASMAEQQRIRNWLEKNNLL